MRRSSLMWVGFLVLVLTIAVHSIPSGVVASGDSAAHSLRRFVPLWNTNPHPNPHPTSCSPSIDIIRHIPGDSCTIFLSALHPFGEQKSTCCDDPTNSNYGTCETSSNCNGLDFMVCNGGNCPTLNSPANAPLIQCKVTNPTACTRNGDKCWGTVICPNGPCPNAHFGPIFAGDICISDGSGSNNIPNSNGFLTGEVKICGACAEIACPPNARGVEVALLDVKLAVKIGGHVYSLTLIEVKPNFYVAYIGNHVVTAGDEILFTPTYTTVGRFRYSVNFALPYIYDSPSGVQIKANLIPGTNLIQLDVIQNPLCGDYIAEYSITIYQGSPPPPPPP